MTTPPLSKNKITHVRKETRLEFIKAVETNNTVKIQELKGLINHNPEEKRYLSQELFLMAMCSNHNNQALYEYIDKYFTIEVPINTLNIAIKAGNFELMKTLHKEGCLWNENSCSIAYLKGHIDILDWLTEQGSPYDPRTYPQNGTKKEIIEWLENNKYMWYLPQFLTRPHLEDERSILQAMQRI